jgi:hypothetical protein
MNKLQRYVREKLSTGQEGEDAAGGAEASQSP